MNILNDLNVIIKTDRFDPVNNSKDEIIAVDFDGTLAHYESFLGPTELGKPIPKMVARVKTWLAENRHVVIFTARITGNPEAIPIIENWCVQYLGQKLEVTNIKHWKFQEIWDDRAIQVIPNTGNRIDGLV